MAVYKSKHTTDVRSESESEEKPQAKLWLNIYDPEGSANLPYGLALDTMPYLKGSSEFAQNANGFLFDLLELASSLEEGEEREIDLVVKIKRRSEVSVLPTEVRRKLSWK